MLAKDKLEKIRSFNNDDSDLVLAFYEFINREIPYSHENVYYNIDEIIKVIEDETLYIVFSDCKIDLDNVYTPERQLKYVDVVDEELYYTGKKYSDKLKNIIIENKLKEKLLKYENVKLVFDINSISTFPIWETKMYRRVTRAIENINELEDEELTAEKLRKIVHSAECIQIKNEQLYDIDLIIKYILAVADRKMVSAMFVSNVVEKREKFIIEELKKVIIAANLPITERNEYIYNTTYKYMNEMFSKFNFCNFKENKCLSQRHKSLTNRYPKPKTDGCCFKVFRKCQYNNKDGTCKIECLPCKIFTCPYLSKLGVGVRISELILIRAFMNKKQKRALIYKFYRPKEFFLKKMLRKKLFDDTM